MLCIFLQGANENDPPQYRLMKTTRVPPDGTFHNLQVIPQSEVFDVLHDAHVSNNVNRKGRALHQTVIRRIPFLPIAVEFPHTISPSPLLSITFR